MPKRFLSCVLRSELLLVSSSYQSNGFRPSNGASLGLIACREFVTYKCCHAKSIFLDFLELLLNTWSVLSDGGSIWSSPRNGIGHRLKEKRDFIQKL